MVCTLFSTDNGVHIGADSSNHLQSSECKESFKVKYLFNNDSLLKRKIALDLWQKYGLDILGCVTIILLLVSKTSPLMDQVSWT